MYLYLQLLEKVLLELKDKLWDEIMAEPIKEIIHKSKFVEIAEDERWLMMKNLSTKKIARKMMNKLKQSYF